jgi:hypothetical protein
MLIETLALITASILVFLISRLRKVDNKIEVIPKKRKLKYVYQEITFSCISS